MSASIPSTTLEKFNTFGDLLRFLRRRRGFTQLELSIQVGYSDSQISRLEQNLRLPDIPTIEARFVPALWLEDDPKAVARLLDLAANIRREGIPALGLCPYKGLDFFDEADADLFVGRETLTEKLAESLVALSARPDPGTERFLAIVGASGSGKSSLVRAGLVPALRLKKTSANWPIHVLTPGPHPLESVAVSLTQETRSVISTTALMDDMCRDRRSLGLFIKRTLKPTAVSHLLLVIDQFEELFALCRSEEERSAFIDNLLAAASEENGRVVVVITLRADFYAHCARYTQLRAALAGQQEFIGAMTDEELRRAIEEPARRGQWEFEPGLVDLILQDVGHEPGALPLLSHALFETWQRRYERTLTLSGYTSAGGVCGAIAETAESVFVDQFTPEQQAIARRVFLRLTELGDEKAGGDTRRRATFNELILKPEDTATTLAVLQTLANARLITTSEDSVEIAHEALIREWPTLQAWLEEDREGLRMHRRLSEAALEWSASNREPDLLYRGARLAQAREWAATHKEDLNAQESEFLAASAALAEQEAAEHEGQRQRELVAAQKLAETERASTKNYFMIERSRLAALASNSYNGNQSSDTAALLALRSLLYYGYSPDADGILSKALRRGFMRLVFFQIAGVLIPFDTASQVDEESYWMAVNVDGKIRIFDLMHGGWGVGYSPLVNFTGRIRAAFSRDRAQIVTGDLNGDVFSQNIRGDEIRKFNGHTDAITSVAISPSSKLLVSASSDKTTRVWDALTGQELFRLDSEKPVLAVKFSADEKCILTGGADNIVRLWDVRTATELRQYLGHEASITGVAFSPDGRWIVSSSKDKTTRIWDTSTGMNVRILPHRAGVEMTVFSPDGRLILTGCSDGVARLWSAQTGAEIKQFVGHQAPVISGTFSTDGQTVATGSEDNTIRVWNIDLELGPRSVVGTLPGDLTDIELSPDGLSILLGITPPPARVIDLGTGQERIQFTSQENRSGNPAISHVAISPDGKWAATAEITKAKLWDMHTGQEVHQLVEEGETITDLAFSPDSNYIVTSGNTGARLWEVQTGKRIRKFPTPTWTSAVAFSPDGKYLATGTGLYRNNNILIWDIVSGLNISVICCQCLCINDIDFSPESRYLVTSGDNSAHVWEVKTGVEIHRFTIPDGMVYSVRFSHDGKFVATACDDNSARIWDMDTGQEIRRMMSDVCIINNVRFSADDKFLYTSSSNQRSSVESPVVTVQEWRIDLQTQIDLACAALPRDLTSEERIFFGISDDKPTCPIPQSVP